MCIGTREIESKHLLTLTIFQVVCGIIAGVLHYCFLCAFAWMCLEGMEIYQMLVRVLRPKETNVLWYYWAGYGEKNMSLQQLLLLWIFLIKQ
jgi:hypothetical protein